jgi:PiT family inorganic phosphate transporter
MVTFDEFVRAFVSNHLLAVSMTLVLGTIFVNGATDAANSIAEAVGTRAITFRKAVAMSVVCEFLGLAVSMRVSTAVAETIDRMVDFGGDPHAALIALCAAMVAIVVWGCAAWAFGIPTSESHALIAGLTGAAIALQGGIAGVNLAEWSKVIWGLVLSIAVGLALGFAISRLLRWAFAEITNHQANVLFSKLQVVGAGFGAFMHGAQDGQKFLSTAMLAVMLSTGRSMQGQTSYPVWLMVICAGVLSLGVASGGSKIVSTVGTKVVKMEMYQGAAASLSAALSLLLATVFGLPVSTTNTKTAAIVGAGCSKNPHMVNWGVAREMVMTWVLTFPGCGLIGYVLARVFLRLF